MEELQKMKSISTYAQAKIIFQKGIEKCNKAKEHYLLDGFVTDHINILQDISAFWLALIFFEKDPSTKW